ncbi:FAD-binding oxidoreductase [Candidatus Pseudothioglobus singularis]|nr:FAD-binding oxidoreductase [Candidatus Pseudothioglobus singularis]MDA8691847.1 FAD-binding oxidoreductase [Candidatus Pseudothioglobus singularis]MDC0910513.1 FAD-binding oxidoreductase [Candidatus Pseudothioglobus singularis]
MSEIKLPKNPGATGWKEILPKRKVNPKLSDHINADYLIIGGGFAGLSAARRLNQINKEATIVLLEACEIGEGPAGRNSGFMIDLPHNLASDDYVGSLDKDREQTLINRSAIEFAKSASKEYEMPAEAIQLVGKTNAAATTKGMKFNTEYAKHLDKTSESYKMLDAKEMKELTGIDYYLNGLWTPGTAMLQPALYIQSLADGVSKSPNTTIYENSPVISLEEEGMHDRQKVWKAKTNLGSISSPKVILAVNGLVEKFGYFQNRLMTIFTYSSLSRELTSEESNMLGGTQDWGLTSADAMGSSVRRISGMGGNRILVRNRWSYNPSMEASDSFMNSAANSHNESFKARFPMLDKVSMDYSWGGRLCLSLNNVFAQGEVDEGVYSACCQNGLGTAKGTAIGIITAEKITGTINSLVPDFVDEEVPKKLMPKPFMWFGVNSYMRWKELMAGKEK